MNLSLKKNVLTVQDVAEMLKVCPRTVLNMAKRGDIPASRIGHLWRFEEDAIHIWLKRKSSIRGRGNGLSPYAGLPRSIFSLLRPEQVRFEKSVSCSREVLEDLASLAVRTGHITSYTSLLKSLEEREEMFSTALDEGVAFPHPRRPMPDLETTILSVLVVETGVAFKSPSNGKTHVFVLFCSPDDVTHVRVLARLARIFHQKRRLISKLRHISDPDRISEQLIRTEREKIEIL